METKKGFVQIPLQWKHGTVAMETKKEFCVFQEATQAAFGKQVAIETKKEFCAYPSTIEARRNIQ